MARHWSELRTPDLLDVRLCDLDLSIEGSWLEEPIARVSGELEAHDLRLRPHFWLSDDWFCPDGVPGVAIPFYLAHPRLMRLERSQMLEVEGGSVRQCTRLLRHELGHAIDNGYRLSRKKRWREVFGSNAKAYPKFYRPNPKSKRFVQHLDYWYAQAHPAEDFAETFAVWLNPRSRWRRNYRDWPALKKLEYVDELMDDIAGRARPVESRARPYPLHRLQQTLGEYYELKRERHMIETPSVHDHDLKRLFASAEDEPNAETAVAFLRRNRREIRELVAKWTGEYVLAVDQVFNDLLKRCKQLQLRAAGPKHQLRVDFAILLSVVTMHHLYATRDWIPM